MAQVEKSVIAQDQGTLYVAYGKDLFHGETKL